MPSMAGILETKDETQVASAPRPPSTTRIRTTRIRHHLPTRRSRTAWAVSIILHLVVGLWVAHAVHAMIAAARAPVDTGITIRCLPAIVLPERPADTAPARPTAATDIAEVEPAPIIPPTIAASTPAPADAGYVTVFLGQQDDTVPMEPLRPAARRPFRPPVRAAPADAGPPAADVVQALVDSGPVAIPAEPAEAEPIVIDGPKPEYPAVSLREGHQGKVVLAVRLDDDGRVVEAQVLSSSGHRVLDAAAIKAVRRWRFNAGSAGRRTTVRMVFLTV